MTLLLQGLFIPITSADGDGTPFGVGTNSITFKNPLKSDSLLGFIDSLIGLLMQLAIPVIALFIIYAGFLFVSARGEDAKLTKAKKTLVNTFIGTAIILGAQVIIGVIKATLGPLS